MPIVTSTKKLRKKYWTKEHILAKVLGLILRLITKHENQIHEYKMCKT
jgi:hypothetical protein